MSENTCGDAVMRSQERGLVTDVFLRDRPSFAIEQEAEDGRRWLAKVLTDCDAFREHIGLLSDLFKARYRRALPRRDRPAGAKPHAPTGAGFRYFQLPE